MAPIKRQASSTPQSAQAKKPKAVPMDPRLRPIVGAIEKAGCLPGEVKAMFKAVIGLSLGVPREDRAEGQVQVVGMIGAALKEIEAWHLERTSSGQEGLAAANAELEAAKSTRSKAEGLREATEAAVETKQQALKDAAAAVALALRKAQEAEASRAAGDAELDALELQRQRIETARRDSFLPLKEGTMAGEDVAGAVALLLPLGRELNLEASLAASLGCALSREAGARGSFDEMVLAQFEEDMAKHLDGLAARLAEGARGKAERRHIAEEAAGLPRAAEAAQREREGELATAQAFAEEARAAVAAAQESLEQAGLALELAEAKLERAQSGLASVCRPALAAFELLSAAAGLQAGAADGAEGPAGAAGEAEEGEGEASAAEAAGAAGAAEAVTEKAQEAAAAAAVTATETATVMVAMGA